MLVATQSFLVMGRRVSPTHLLLIAWSRATCLLKGDLPLGPYSIILMSYISSVHEKAHQMAVVRDRVSKLKEMPNKTYEQQVELSQALQERAKVWEELHALVEDLVNGYREVNPFPDDPEGEKRWRELVKTQPFKPN